METAVVKQLLNQPADEAYHFSLSRPGDEAHDVQCVLFDEKSNAPLVWIIPDVLTSEQCDKWIEQAEKAGMSAASAATGSLRTSKRTNKFMSEELSQLVFSQLPPDFKEKLQESDGLSVDSIHANWRIVRYDAGDYFGPHYDQADIVTPLRPDGTKDFFFSSHTLLVNLSRESSSIKGGATRFYPRKNYSKAVDVSVPRGWAIAFSQKGMLHAGHQVLEGTKHVAQAGLLRQLPPGRVFQPSTFRVGPGLTEAVNLHAQSLQQQQEA